MRGRLYYESALIAQAEGQADTERTALQHVLALAPASLDLKEIRTRLARLSADAPGTAMGR
jgi:hypothetical protein